MTDPKLDLDYYRKKLCCVRDELLSVEKSGKAAAETVALDQSKVGRLSRMDALQLQAMSAASNIRRERQLQRVADALIRIKRNDFGWCDECGVPIDPKRLEFDPSVVSCIACARKNEDRV